MNKAKTLNLILLRKLKENYQLTLILILSSILNFYNLQIEEYANEYYAAGVKSMTMNLKNFFFAAFDPAGFVTIDKPPVGFWIQAISAKIFGFSGWSIILPQALAGVVSVWLLYYTVNRVFGKTAGLIAALCLSITPIFVAASRNNTIDNILVLTSIAACLFISLAAEEGNFKYLMLSLALVGIGFNIKMLEAYMIVPAIYLTYVFAQVISFKKRVIHLALGTAILVVVSLSWAVAVDLTPAKNRPFIGSSTNNTVMELIAGHNGAERLNFGIKSNGKKTEDDKIPEEKKGIGISQMVTNNGKAGIVRLFSPNNLSDQISWFLPLAIFGLIICVLSENWKDRNNSREKLNLILWGMCLIPEYIYFSFIGTMAHSYYLTMMAPSICVLAGVGIAKMWVMYKEGGIKAAILPTVLIINGIVELLMMSYYIEYSITNEMMIISGILCILFSILLIIFAFIKSGKYLWKTEKYINVKKFSLTVAFVGILIAPSFWSFTTVAYKMSGSAPSAGLRLVNNKDHQVNIKDWFLKAPNGNTNTEKLVNFIDSREGNEKYFLAAEKANDIADFIIRTGNPVMTVGGFSGRDKILTLDEFESEVKNGEVKYVLLRNNENENKDIAAWIRKNGKKIDLDAQSKSSKSKGNTKKESVNSEFIYELS